LSKPAEPVAKVNAHALGLDVHKNLIVWCLLDRRGRLAAQGRTGGTPQDLLDLLRTVVGRKKAHIAFEASSCSLWVYDLLVDRLGDPSRVHVAHARKVDAIANSRDKSDENDAWWLAYLTYEGRLPEVRVSVGVYRELRTVGRHRTSLVQRRTRLAQAIHAHFRQAGMALPRTQLSAARSWDCVREQAVQLPGVVREIVLEGLEEMARLSRQIEHWNARLAQIAKELPEVEEIRRQLPGFGPLLAAVVVGELGELSRFGHAKALGRYAGLVPTRRGTGGDPRHGQISLEGSAHLRWALVQAAAASLRVKEGPGSAVAAWIRTHQRHLGSKKKGLIAGARKLAESIWLLFHHGKDFDIRRPFGRYQPAA